jgi:uncharacterized protein (DUF1330 family)
MSIHLWKSTVENICLEAQISRFWKKNRGNTFIAILQFPDAASFEAFATDPDYAPHGKARQEGAINSFQLIDDTDAAGTIPYLAAG